MAGEVKKTLSQFINDFADNNSGNITPQLFRNFIASTYNDGGAVKILSGNTALSFTDLYDYSVFNIESVTAGLNTVVTIPVVTSASADQQVIINGTNYTFINTSGTTINLDFGSQNVVRHGYGSNIPSNSLIWKNLVQLPEYSKIEITYNNSKWNITSESYKHIFADYSTFSALNAYYSYDSATGTLTPTAPSSNQVVDGYSAWDTTNIGQIILISGQANAIQNGLYIVESIVTNSTFVAPLLKRAYPELVIRYNKIRVKNGSAFGGKIFEVTNQNYTTSNMPVYNTNTISFKLDSNAYVSKTGDTMSGPLLIEYPVSDWSSQILVKNTGTDASSYAYVTVMNAAGKSASLGMGSAAHDNQGFISFDGDGFRMIPQDGTGNVIAEFNRIRQVSIFNARKVTGVIPRSFEIDAENSRLRFIDNNFNRDILYSGIGSANYTYQLPSASGTFALTSDLTAYVAKTGDTMTGALTIANNTGGNMLTLNSGTSDFAQIRSKGVNNTNGWIFGSGSNGWFAIRNEDTGTTTFQISRTTNNATFTNRVTSAGLTSTSDLSVSTTSVFNGNNTHQHASDVRSTYTINSVQTGQLQAVANTFIISALAGSNLEFYTNGASRGSISNVTNQWTFNTQINGTSASFSSGLSAFSGTFTSNVSGANATFSGLISASTTPTLGQHLTNKTYVDGAISGLSSTYQPLDGDLTSIAGLSGTSGLLRKTATNTWELDTNTYLTSNQTITLSGEVTGSGTTAITATISNSAVVGKVLTGFNATVGGNISATDTILQGLQKLEFKSNNIVATSDVDYLGYSELGIVSVGNASYLNNVFTLTSIEIIGLVDSPLTSSKRTKKITSTGSINLTILNGTFNASTPYATVYIFNGIDQSWTNSTTISQLYVQSGSLSAEDRRYKMPICILTSQDLTNISGITWNTQFVGNSSKLFKDFLDVVGNPKNGLNLSGSGTNLNINVSNGSIFGIGYNTENGYDYTNANDVITFDAISSATFYLATISDISSISTQNIPTTQYNTTGNTIVGIPSNDWVNHRVFGIHDHNSPNANGLLVVIQYGQNTYANKSDALAAISSESYTLNQATSRMTFLGVVTIKQGSTLSNSATFTKAGHFGDLSSSSSGGSFVGVSDTNSIDMTDTSGVITADVKISPDAGNKLIINANGLYSARELPLSGTTAQYLRGDNTWQTLNTTNVTEGTNLYYTNSRAINSVLTGFNATVGGAITATDTILQGLQKLEFKLNNSVGGVSSVFGRNGAVVAQNGDYTTTQVTEGTNLYFTEARVRNTTLSGLSIVNSPITSTDNIITAFGETQGQIDAINTSLSNYVPKSFASSQSLSYTGAIGDQGSFVFGSAGSIFTYENQSGKTFGINPRLATITFANLSAGNDKNLIFPASGAFDYTLPSTSGTIALTSQIPDMANYLPKSFATSQLLNFTGTNPSQFRFQGNGNFITTDITSGLSISLATEQLSIFFGSNRLFGGNGGSNVYTLPNATGTIALTSQIPSVPVTSIFGRIGDVVAQSGDYTTTQVTEGTNLYFTEARVRSTLLTGFSANNSAIVATDSVLVGFNKAQGQINSISSTISGLSSVYQPLDADLTSIAGLSGTSGLLRKTATDTWSLDTNTYLTSNQTITLSGEVTGSGTTSISTTVSNSAVVGKVLTGFSVGTNTGLSATDTILQAFGKTQGQINAKENSIASGTTSQYWRGDKTWQTLDTTIVTEGTNLYFTQARAIASPLTGFSTGTNTAIVATDTVLQAFGKTQAQINTKANTTDLSNYLLLTGGTLTGGIGITSSATTGQPSFITATTSAGAALALRYTETTVGSVPADVYQFRMGGTDGNRNIVWSYFDNTPVFTIASTGITIPNLASTSATITNLTVSSGISAANIPSGTIASGGNLGLDASGNIVKATVSGGGGSSYLLGSVSVTDAAWSGNTDYTYTTTITGATIGSPVIVSPDTNIAGAIFANTLTLFAWVSATNQVSVRVRVATWVPLPTTRTLRLGVLI